MEIKITYDDIEEVIIDKHRKLTIKFKKTENANKIKRHLTKQFPGDQIDKNIKHD